MDQRTIEDISNFIFMNDVPQKSDIIFIPGTSQSAITEKAAELFCSGYAKYVLPSGMYSGKIGKFASDKIDKPRYYGEYNTEFEFCKSILIKNGVPESAVICENRATNSMENAEFSAKVTKDLGIEINTAILCCQSFHSRRAFMSYSLHFPKSKIFVVPTDTQGITKENWFEKKTSYKKVMSELTKCGKYFIDYKKEN